MEHLSRSRLNSDNLECLTEKVGTFGLQITRKNCCGAAKKRARKARPAEAPTGDSGAAKLNLFESFAHKSCRSAVHLKLMGRPRRGPAMDTDLVRLDRNPRKERDTERTQAKDGGRLGALQRACRLRGPSRLGKLVTSGLLGRALGRRL